MSDFLDGAVVPPRDWDDVERWLVHSIGRIDVGDVLEVGPADVTTDRLDGHVPCVQVVALERECRWLQLSTEVLGLPLLDLAVEGVELDTWVEESDGSGVVIHSFDHQLLAAAAVVWFRDRHTMAFADLGCALHPAGGTSGSA